MFDAHVSLFKPSILIQITLQMPEQVVLGRFSDHYTYQVILGWSLNLDLSICL